MGKKELWWWMVGLMIELMKIYVIGMMGMKRSIKNKENKEWNI